MSKRGRESICSGVDECSGQSWNRKNLRLRTRNAAGTDGSSCRLQIKEFIRERLERKRGSVLTCCSSFCSPSGGIGRHRRLKISRSHGHGGSTPSSGTNHPEIFR